MRTVLGFMRHFPSRNSYNAHGVDALAFVVIILAGHRGIVDIQKNDVAQPLAAAFG